MSEILDLPDRGPSIRKSTVVVRGRNPYNTTTSAIPPSDTTTYPWPHQTNTSFPGVSPSTSKAQFNLTSSKPLTTSSPSTSNIIINQLNSTLQTTVSEITTAVHEYLTLSPGDGTKVFQNATIPIPEVSSTPASGLFNVTTAESVTELSVTALETANAELLRVALWQWMSPFIFLLGFFGNIAILIILQNRPVMSDNTTSTYVRCLAIADLCTVITGIIPEWLIFTGIFDVEQYHPVTCKFYKFFAYTASDASIWILTAFSAERFIAVVFPFKRQKGWCKVSQVKIICIGLVLLGVVKNLQSFWTRGAEFNPTGENGTLVLRSNCGYPTAADRHFNLFVRPWLVLVTINIIPMILLWFCNFSVIWTISRRRTLQRLQLHMSSASKRASALTQQVTIMCLCASFSFIIFMTPSFILFIGKPYWNDPASKKHYLIAKAVNNQLMYINNSINFYLYLFSGERFRRSVISIFIKCQWRRRDLRSLSVNPASMATNTRTTRSRNNPYEVAVIANNGVQLKSCPDVYETSSVSGTPRGSKLSLHSNAKA